MALLDTSLIYIKYINNSIKVRHHFRSIPKITLYAQATERIGI